MNFQPSFQRTSPHPQLHTLPALKAAIIISLGIASGYWIQIPPALPAAVSVICLIMGIISRRASLASLFTILAFFSAAFLSVQTALKPYNFPAANLRITGRTLEPAYKFGRGWQAPMELTKLQLPDGQESRASGKVWMRIKAGTVLPPAGSILQAQGLLIPLRQRRNPQDYDLGGWRLRNGYRGEFQADDDQSVKIISTRPRLREWFYNRILDWSHRFGPADAPLVMALLSGVRREMDEGFREDLQRTGLSHLIALSGLNLGFAATLLLGMGALVRLPLRLRYGVALLGVGLYTLCITPRGSLGRAAVMVAALLLGPVLKRWSSPTNNLAFAAVVILIFRPGELFDAGFQMSFAAVAGILLILPWTDEMRHRFTRQGASLRRFNQYLLSPLLISTAASLLILPLTSYHFGQAAWGAPLFNLIAIPLLGVIFSGLWVSWLVSLLAPPLSSILIDGLSSLFAVWRFITHYGADFGWFAEIRLSPWAVALAIGIIIWGGSNYPKRFRRLVITVLAAVAVLIWDNTRARGEAFQAWFLDVGHGDAGVWLFPGGKTAVIDGGPETGASQGVVNSFLKYRQRARIDLLVATHPEADHIGGLIRLIRDFPVSLAVCGQCSASTKTFRQLNSLSQERNLRWLPVKAGDLIGGLPKGFDLRVLNPPSADNPISMNDASVVMMLEMMMTKTDTLRILMTGDIEYTGEIALIKQGGLRAELLKVPHHGSGTSSSEAFLSQVQPQIAVISQGSKYEQTKSLKPETIINRLRSRGIEVHQTQVEGAAGFRAVKRDGAWRWQSIDWRQPKFIHWLLGMV